MTLDLQPTLVGPSLTLRPLRSEDLEPLYAVAADPLLWEQHPARDRYRRPVFEEFFDAGLASGGALLVLDHDGHVLGTSRFHGHDPADSSVEIGWTFLARGRWGGATNRELKTLMLDHAFTELAAVRFRVGEHNVRSRTAVEKLGARLRSPQADAEGNVHYVLTKDAWASRRG